MILNERHVYYAIELRIKTTKYHGTLCKMPEREYLIGAMRYFDEWDHKGFLSNPYARLDEHVFVNMTPDLFKAFVELTNYWGPEWTRPELGLIHKSAHRFGYNIIRHKMKITLRKNHLQHLR